MTGHLNHLSAVIENKCGASLTILKHSPISVLVSQISLLAYFEADTPAAAAGSFTPAVQKQRGVRTIIHPMLLTHTIRLSWTLVPFSFLAGILYSVSRALSATSRCPLRDVAIETQNGHKNRGMLFHHMRLLFKQTLLLMLPALVI